MTEWDQKDQPLCFVLAELDFPARRWEILTEADIYAPTS